MKILATEYFLLVSERRLVPVQFRNMRLLNARTYQFHEFYDGNTPPYAILSHTWGNGEVSFQDLCHGLSPKVQCKNGWRKIDHCCRQARKDYLEYVWVDTCCIDKSSSAELQEAINSMFDWYARSSECYVFLADFQRPAELSSTVEIQAEDAAASAILGTVDVYLPGFKDARWFQRGWTLQELLAPESVRFFDTKWSEFGNKVSLRRQLAQITRISESILLATIMGARQALSSVSIAQRMSWASSRITTRTEDTAYCLLGIFDVNMPLLYGEGPKAFLRLQEEIMKISPDQSLLAWGFGCKNSSLWGLSTALALSPADFAGCNNVVSWGAARPGDSFSMTQRGLCLQLPVVISLDGGNLIYFALNCTTEDKIPPGGDAWAARIMAIPFLRPQTWADKMSPHLDEYYPLSARMPLWIDRASLSTAGSLRAFLPRMFRHGSPIYHKLRVALNLENMSKNWFVAGVFPPEKSDNDLLMIHPWRQFQKAENQRSSCYFVIHFANSFLELNGFIVVLELNGVDEIEHFESPRCTLPSFSDLQSSVFSIIADVTNVNVDDLWTETKLDTLGLDSLMSLEIAGSLGELLHIKINTGLFFRSETIGDLLAKLRFVTRPGFGLLRDTLGDDKGRKSSSVPRLHVTNIRSCVIGVGGDFSLMELSEGAVARFRDRLSFTEATSTLIKLETPVNEMQLLVDISKDPVNIGINVGTVEHTSYDRHDEESV